MKIATWNVNGIRARWDDLRAYIDERQPDILCLQELKATATQVPEPLTGLPDYHSRWHGGPGGYSGVSLHVRRSFWPQRVHFEVPAFDFEHRIVATHLDAWVFASIYVPNGNKNYEAKETFLRGLIAYATELTDAGKTVVLCGDLNVTRSKIDLHPKQRNKSAIGQTDAERELFAALLDVGLTDSLRALHPTDETLFTWWPPWREEKQKNRGWRIDYVLASSAIAAAISDVAILKESGSSDHAPFEVTFDAQPGHA